MVSKKKVTKKKVVKKATSKKVVAKKPQVQKKELPKVKTNTLKYKFGIYLTIFVLSLILIQIIKVGTFFYNLIALISILTGAISLAYILIFIISFFVRKFRKK